MFKPNDWVKVTQVLFEDDTLEETQDYTWTVRQVVSVADGVVDIGLPLKFTLNGYPVESLLTGKYRLQPATEKDFRMHRVWKEVLAKERKRKLLKEISKRVDEFSPKEE